MGCIASVSFSDHIDCCHIKLHSYCEVCKYVLSLRGIVASPSHILTDSVVANVLFNICNVQGGGRVPGESLVGIAKGNYAQTWWRLKNTWRKEYQSKLNISPFLGQDQAGGKYNAYVKAFSAEKPSLQATGGIKIDNLSHCSRVL